MTTSYSIGDPIRISDNDGDAYAIVIGHVDASTLEVQFLEQGIDRIYRTGSSCYHVNVNSIDKHVPLHGSDDNAPRAYHELGFRMLDGASFVKYDDEQGDRLFPVGDEAYEVQSDDEDDDGSDLRDFIVPDDECEPFTHAAEDNDFVRDTHAAVRAFNDWTPRNEQEEQARSFMIRQTARAAHIDDEARFSRNMPGTNYTRPS